MTDPSRRYRLSAEFERAVAALTATDRRFFARIGHALDPELLPTDHARTLVETAQAIARENGQGADGNLLVIQRMHRRMGEGRLKYGDLMATAAYLEDAFMAGLPPVDTVVAELRPVVQVAIRDVAVRTAVDEYGKGDDMQRTSELIERAQTVGLTTETAGTRLGSGSFSEIATMRNLEKLPTGIDDIDLQLGGGSARGQVSLVSMDTGVGKSTCLSQMYGCALMQGLHAGYATLELPSPVVQARTIAALTSVPIDDVMLEDQLAQDRLTELLPELGIGWVQDFAPNVTTIPDIARWIDECEHTAGRPMDVLFLDYMDKLTGPKPEMTSYELGRVVTNGLCGLAARKGREMWLWTASQPKARKSPNALIDTGDLADSRNKGRLINLMISGNAKQREDGGVDLLWFVAKNTTGPSRMTIGPLPTERHIGRVAPSMTLGARWRQDLYQGI